MGFFSRDWIDRLLGRRRNEPGRDEPDPSAPADAGALEDGATGARDETVRDPSPPQPPPGTG